MRHGLPRSSAGALRYDSLASSAPRAVAWRRELRGTGVRDGSLVGRRWSHKDVQGCYVVKGVEARWVSGARAMTDPVRLCGSATGSYTITLNRDASYPDLEKDLQFALQIQTMLAPHNAVRQQAAMQLLLNNMHARPVQPYQLPMPPPPRPSVNTNCFQIGNTWSCTTR